MKTLALPADDASFRAVCVFLAQHPMYAQMPLRRTLEIFHAIKLGQTLVAIDDSKRLLGLVLWKECGAQAAREAVQARKMPGGRSIVDHGEAAIATAFMALDNETGRVLWDRFIEQQRGRVLLYERHRPGRAAAAIFKWIDKSGRLMGTDV
jgi:hypothetical protein